MDFIIVLIIFIVVVGIICKVASDWKAYEKDFEYFKGKVWDPWKKEDWIKKEESCSLSNTGKMTVFINKQQGLKKLEVDRRIKPEGGFRETEVSYEMLNTSQYLKIFCIPFNSEQDCISNEETIKNYFKKSDFHDRWLYRVKNVAVIIERYEEAYSSHKGEVIPLEFDATIVNIKDKNKFVSTF